MTRDVHYVDPHQQDEAPTYDDVAAAQYVSGLQPIQERRRRKRRVRILAVVLLLIAVVVAGSYAAFWRPDNSPEQSAQADAEQVQPMPHVSSEPTEYVSRDKSLRFFYPGDWHVNDAEPGVIRVESPVVKLADLNSNVADTKVVVSILGAGSDVPGFENGGAIAVKDSEILAYSSPSQNQRAETYISFGGFGGRALSAVFITGDSGYQVEQLIPASDVKKGDPIITVMFYACHDAACAADASELYAIDPAEWSANETLQAAYDLLVSLRVE